jgi:hypothetical protein
MEMELLLQKHISMHQTQGLELGPVLAQLMHETEL